MSQHRLSSRIERCIASTTVDPSMQERLRTWFRGSRNQPPEFFDAVEKVAASVKLAIAANALKPETVGAGAAFIVSLDEYSRICLADAAVATKAIISGRHRLATSSEIREYRADQKRRRDEAERAADLAATHAPAGDPENAA